MSKRFWTILGYVAGVVGIVGFGIQIHDVYGNRKQKQQKFDAIVQSAVRVDADQFMSSHNMTDWLERTLREFLENPRNVSLDDGLRLASLWNKHATYLNNFWSNLAHCIDSDECSPGVSKETVCRNLKFEIAHLEYVQENILKIEQLGLNQIAGPGVEQPSIANLQTIFKRAC